MSKSSVATCPHGRDDVKGGCRVDSSHSMLTGLNGLPEGDEEEERGGESSANRHVTRKFGRCHVRPEVLVPSATGAHCRLTASIALCAFQCTSAPVPPLLATLRPLFHTPLKLLENAMHLHEYLPYKGLARGEPPPSVQVATLDHHKYAAATYDSLTTMRLCNVRARVALSTCGPR